jgi:hypothetical protein
MAKIQRFDLFYTAGEPIVAFSLPSGYDGGRSDDL